MKIKLIAPHQEWEAGISSAETFTIQKVNLPLLSALTPPEHSVKIVDEAFGPDDCDDNYDLVGVAVMTDLAIRAYTIAEAYRKCGVPVVLGGIHPTVMPEEALQHADAVVVGEAEMVWPHLLQDVQMGSLKKIYRASDFFELAKLQQPDRKCYPRRHQRGYTPFVVGLETSRGCPFDCSFCTVSQVMGRKLRFRPIVDVVREIEHIETPNLFIVDDALGLHPEVSKNLFARMIPLKRHWVGQGPVSLAEDLELLHIMQLSGCEGLLVGF